MAPPVPSGGISDPGLAAVRRAVRDHRGIVLAEGVVLLVLGIAAALLPFLAGLATAVVLGWLLIAAGVSGLLFTFRGRGMPGFGWSLLSGLAALLAGIGLAWNPLGGLVTLALVLAAFFAADGLFTVGLAVSHRRELSGRWEWMLVGGLLDLMLAAVIWSGWPGTALWTVGLLVGLSLLYGGLSLVAMALAAGRDEARRP